MRAAIVSEYQVPPVAGDRPAPAAGRGHGPRRAARGGAQPRRPRDRVGFVPVRQSASSVRPRDRGRRARRRVGTLRARERGSGLRVVGSASGPTERSPSGSRRPTRYSSRFRPARTISSPLRFGVAGLAGWLPLAWLAPVRAGETVLVLGATGNVGAVAVQAAKILGAGRVVAVGRDADRLARARASSAPTRPSSSAGTTSASGSPLRSTARRRRSSSTRSGVLRVEAAMAVAGRRGANRPRRAVSGTNRDDRLGPRAREAAADPRLLELRRPAGRGRPGLRGSRRACRCGADHGRRSRRCRSSTSRDAWARQVQGRAPSSCSSPDDVGQLRYNL